ncbi:PREDICTED: PLAT domain-containing protein 3-like [Nelumbo nucifera]|uniref:PLAT domain-containing protein 3-like n=1 Tax=Nelumbo nucifera TaxID=4432 RepID=A0A1U8A9X7_NELNU|nr:PREDICTED: PLAT domain-containing protein 3-like [Nelumbo nucifera]
MTNRLFCTLTFLALYLSVAQGLFKSEKCVYTLYVKTGTFLTIGTNAKIGVTLTNAKGKSVRVPDLRKWGIMEHGHSYFQRGNLDVFSSRAPCVAFPLCQLNLTVSGGTLLNSWYCEYVDVTSTDPHKNCSKTIFDVKQWLVAGHLSASVDKCNRKVHSPRNGTPVAGNGVLREGGSAASESQ